VYAQLRLQSQNAWQLQAQPGLYVVADVIKLAGADLAGIKEDEVSNWLFDTK
jgi:hypothetical protein